jgi:alkyl-hydroperoxide reductase/thiol specific antioxidant family protein
LRERQEELAARNAVVVVIGFEAARRVRGYCGNLRLGDWPCLVDEALTVYQAYGLERLAWWRTFTLASLRGYARFWRRGATMPRPRADIRQAGGDFVIDPAGRLAFVHPGRAPHDRPGVDTILAVIPPPESVI